MTNNDRDDAPVIGAARELIAGCFHGVLSTQSTEHPGYPFGSVLPYSLDEAGRPLILVSHLARHTRHLLESPCCSLLLKENREGDVQRHVRLTMLADAHPLDSIDPALSERHFRYFPESRDYFEQMNFRFFRLEPVRFHCVGGFGAARWIGADRLVDRFRFALDEELRILEVVDDELRHHLHRVYRSEFFREQSADDPVVVAGLDRRGIDLRHDDHLCRRWFPDPVSDTEELRDAVARL